MCAEDLCISRKDRQEACSSPTVPYRKTLPDGLVLKSIAGEAADAYRLTSEAHFLSQLELRQHRYESVDLPFLAARVFGSEEVASAVLPVLREQVHGTRAGVPVDDGETSARLRLAANRTGLRRSGWNCSMMGVFPPRIPRASLWATRWSPNGALCFRPT